MKRAMLLISALPIWGIPPQEVHSTNNKLGVPITLPDILSVVPRNISETNLEMTFGFRNPPKCYILPVGNSQGELPVTTYPVQPPLLGDEENNFKKQAAKRNAFPKKKNLFSYYPAILKQNILRLKIPP
jgi:hypothetical protein